jgi:hypothetical protein
MANEADRVKEIDGNQEKTQRQSEHANFQFVKSGNVAGA